MLKGSAVRRFLQFAILNVLLWACLPSLAASPSPITLAYDAPWECPDRQYFWQQIGSRSKWLAQVKPAAAAIVVGARIDRLDSHYSGHLRLIDQEGTIIERDIGGPNCVDVTSALALISAVAIDASLGPRRSDLDVPSRHRKSERWSVGAVGGIHTAIQPNKVAPTLGLSLSLHERSHSILSEYRLEGLVGWSDRLHVTSESDARFLWLASRATACPYQIAVSSVAFGPCALFEMGALRGTGSGAHNGHSNTGWWLAPGALLNWSIQPDPLRFRLAAGLIRPLVRDRFFFSPATEIFTPPNLGLVAEVEVGWAFE